MKQPNASKWRCPECASPNVEISLPVWFTEDQSGHLTQVSIDDGADPLWWYCQDCEATDGGAPARNEEDNE
jgi:hypothetical protein